ncbi:MAG: hypothetical protein EBZ09_11940, partial [Betaproteobacteria bacterium]|nr:hypothetical protein [Betaproteobacteria bacterium]
MVNQLVIATLQKGRINRDHRLHARESGQHQGESRRRHIAVIGDGALSGGMAF